MNIISRTADTSWWITKPVIGFYDVNGLIASFGKDQIKPQLDYLRQACVDAGFGGAYILVVSGSTNADTLRKFKGFVLTLCTAITGADGLCGRVPK